MGGTLRIKDNIPKWPCAQDETFQIKTLHEHLDAAVDLAQEICPRHENVLEDQFACVGPAHPKLVQLASAREALESLLDHEGCDSLGALLRLGFGIHDDVVCIRALEKDVSH